MRAISALLVAAGIAVSALIADPTQSRADNGQVAAGIIGGLAVGTLLGAAVAQPRYKETDAPPQLDSDDAAMTYKRFIRCGSATPVANYYEPAPVYVAPESVAPERVAPELAEPEPVTCYWTHGEPVWDDYRGIWVRPRIQVCD